MQVNNNFPLNETTAYRSRIERYSASPSGYGSSYAQYEQTLLQYISQIKSRIHTLQQGTPAYTQAVDYLNTALGYLQMVDPQMAADPTLGGTGWGGAGIGMEADPYGGIPDFGGKGPQFPISYQDSSQVMTDEGPHTTITLGDKDTDTRLINVFQKDNTLLIPSNAANVKVTAQADDAAPGKTMFVVTYTCNGHTRTIQYHNADRENFKLNIQTPDKSQALLDGSLGSLQSKVKISELGEAPEETKGTPPDKTDKDTRTWNKNDKVDYYVTEGKETDKIFASDVNITLPDRSHKAYVTKTGDHDYVIEIQDENGKSLRRIEARQVKNINFDHVSDDNLFFQYEPTKAPAPSQGMGSVENALLPKDDHFKAWSDSTHDKDTQLSVGGVKEPDTSPANASKNPPPDVPSTDGGKTLTYNKNSDPAFTNYFDDPNATNDDKTVTYLITANGTVHLNPAHQDDHFTVKKDGDWYVITATGSDSNGQSKQVIYKIKAANIQNVKFEGVNPKSVSFQVDGDGNDVSGCDANDKAKFVSSDGKTIGEAQKAVTPQPLTWPGVDVLNNVPTGGDGGSTNKAIELVQKMSKAFSDNNWGDVNKMVGDLNGPFTNGSGNNVVRKVITAIYKAAGSDPTKFKALMKLIPEETRKSMRAMVVQEQGELSETISGDQWNSAGTAAQIDLSLQP